MALQMNTEEMRVYLAEVFPQLGTRLLLDDVGEMSATMRLCPVEGDIRPGRTVSGPALFALADVTIYVATMAMVGPKALAVTTNASIDFMRKPAADQGDLIGKGRILKLGRALVVGDVMITAEDAPDALIARASMTYSLPPVGSAADKFT